MSGNFPDDKNDFNYQQELDYQDFCTQGAKTDRLPNYKCKKPKFESGISLLWGISREDV